MRAWSTGSAPYAGPVRDDEPSGPTWTADQRRRIEQLVDGSFTLRTDDTIATVQASSRDLRTTRLAIVQSG